MVPLTLFKSHILEMMMCTWNGSGFFWTTITLMSNVESIKYVLGIKCIDTIININLVLQTLSNSIYQTDTSEPQCTGV